MKTLASMSEDDLRHYMNMMGQATASIVPPDGLFCLVIFDDKQKANYVSNCSRMQIPAALRELANSLEANMAKTN